MCKAYKLTMITLFLAFFAVASVSVTAVAAEAGPARYYGYVRDCGFDQASQTYNNCKGFAHLVRVKYIGQHNLYYDFVWCQPTGRATVADPYGGTAYNAWAHRPLYQRCNPG